MVGVGVLGVVQGDVLMVQVVLVIGSGVGRVQQQQQEEGEGETAGRGPHRYDCRSSGPTNTVTRRS